MDPILFYAAAAVALASALGVVAQRNPIYSAFSLVVTLCSLSVIYGLLGSPFIAVLQVIVYAGAVMVLFLFVLMLLNVKREGAHRSPLGLKAVAVALVGLLMLQGARVLLRADSGAAVPAYEASIPKMAGQLFSVHFLYAFEATSILLLASLVGAVALARRDGGK